MWATKKFENIMGTKRTPIHKIEISGTRNEKRRFRKFNTYKIYWRKEVQREVTINLPNHFVWMDGKAEQKNDAKAPKVV